MHHQVTFGLNFSINNVTLWIGHLYLTSQSEFDESEVMNLVSGF